MQCIVLINEFNFQFNDLKNTSILTHEMVHSDGFHFHGNCLRQEYTMLIMDSII